MAIFTVRSFQISALTLFLATALTRSALAASPDSTRFERDCAKIATFKGNAHQKLWELFRLHWEYQMKEFPEWATYTGFPGQNDRWSDISLEAVARRKRESAAPAQALAKINRKALSPADQDNYDLFKYNLDMDREGQRYRGELLAITQLGGAPQDVPNILDSAPQAKVSDYEDRLARLRAVPHLMDQTIALLQEGLRRGITSPKITLRDVPDQVGAQEVTDPEKSPLLSSFRTIPESIPAADRARLKTEAAAVLVHDAVPAFHHLHEFLVSTYIPGARESIAWSALPDGKAWYEYLVRHETTARLTADELHELGHREVARIRGEMDALISSLKFKGDFADFGKFLRTDSRFFFDKPEELVAAYRDIAKRIDPELPRLFGKLPRLTYGVKPVPAFDEKSQTTAYYEGGSLKTGRAGYFYANTYDLKTRPKWEMESLTLHEAVPGHHLQLSLAAEMQDAPEFRKNGGYTAYVEGWGLYSESLGSELGLYKDPYSKFGQLTYEVWRAIRLVLDTGIHAKGWTRQQAIDYFRQNTAKTDHDIEVEVDRYIVMPGQALGYKSGELRIKALRALATRELGDHFDIRAFHDEVLAHGALPLDILQTDVEQWIHAQKNAPKTATP